ncbi:hypothetical protein C0V97_07930 [Asaia sp. W19]|nr:hypothetical protein C0V97_07930 [Asaia sp. W19]
MRISPRHEHFWSPVGNVLSARIKLSRRAMILPSLWGKDVHFPELSEGAGETDVLIRASLQSNQGETHVSVSPMETGPRFSEGNLWGLPVAANAFQNNGGLKSKTMYGIMPSLSDGSVGL